MKCSIILYVYKLIKILLWILWISKILTTFSKKYFLCSKIIEIKHDFKNFDFINLLIGVATQTLVSRFKYFYFKASGYVQI